MLNRELDSIRFYVREQFRPQLDWYRNWSEQRKAGRKNKTARNVDHDFILSQPERDLYSDTENPRRDPDPVTRRAVTPPFVPKHPWSSKNVPAYSADDDLS
jgi:hypothetical protein